MIRTFHFLPILLTEPLQPRLMGGMSARRSAPLRRNFLAVVYQITRMIFEHGYRITFARFANERSVAIDMLSIEKTALEAGPRRPSDFKKLKAALETILVPTPPHPAAGSPLFIS